MISWALVLVAACASQSNEGERHDTRRTAEREGSGADPDRAPREEGISSTLLDVDVPAHEEPPLQLAIERGGVRTAAVEGQSVRLGTAVDAPELTVHVMPHRLFRAAGLRFRYPRYYTFEADRSPHLLQWILSGNNHKISVFLFPTSAGSIGELLRSTVREVAERLQATTPTQPLNLRLGGRDYAGERVIARVAGAEIRVDFVGVVSSAGPVVLSFQDNESSGTAEGASAMHELAREFDVQ